MEEKEEKRYRRIEEWQKIISEWAVTKGFSWTKKDTNTMLLRLHSEVSEAAEALRDKNIDQFAEELADVFIRLVNLCGVWNIDLEKEVAIKHNKNIGRPFLHGRVYK